MFGHVGKYTIDKRRNGFCSLVALETNSSVLDLQELIRYTLRIAIGEESDLICECSTAGR
eukprot:5939356-Amphidinium_carterae.1